MPERKTTAEEMEELKKALRAVFEPPLQSYMQWLDRQLQRSPRLYRWLSR